MNRQLPILIVGALSILSASATDVVVSLPPGHEPNWHVFDAQLGNVVVAIHPAGDESTSTVFQVRQSHGTVTTEVQGAVTGLEYSPDGQHVLVHHKPAPTEHEFEVTLLDSQGQIRWNGVESRVFHFSADGTRMWSKEVVSLTSPEARDIVVYDLDGNRVTKWEVGDPRRVVNAVVPGDGSEIVVVRGLSLIKFHKNNGPGTVWEHVLPAEADRVVVGASLLGTNTLVLDQQGSAMEFRNLSDGALIHRYDPVALAESDPNKTPDDYIGFEAALGQDEQHPILFDRSSVGYVLDLTSGELTPQTTDVTASPGYTLIPRIRDNVLVLLSTGSVKIRTVVD